MIPPIVITEWLASEIDDVVLCDVRSTMQSDAPYDDYRASHLPGARFVSLDADLADEAGPVVGRHPLPSAERFADALGAAGIGDTDIVVAYDIGPGGLAARLAWMLRIIGQDAALLSGGLAAWSGPLEVGEMRVDPVVRTVVPWPRSSLADADDVARRIASGGVVVDSREPVRYRGETEPIDAVAGHVPGAINLPFADNLHEGRFRSAHDLRTRFDTLATDPAAIVYCGSGVTACHNALAIEAAGLPRPRVYVGSWSGWSTDPTRPIAATTP